MLLYSSSTDNVGDENDLFSGAVESFKQKDTTVISQRDHSTLPPSYIFLTIDLARFGLAFSTGS